MKEEYRIFYFALLRRCIPWLLIAYSVLVIEDFTVHALLHVNKVSDYFCMNSVIRIALLGSWNVLFSIYNVCQVHKVGGVPSPLSTIQERLKFFNFNFLFNTFCVFLLHPALKPLGNVNAWRTLLLPISSCVMMLIFFEKSQPISFLISNNKPSLTSQVLKTLVNTGKGLLPALLSFCGIFIALNIIIWFWDNLIQQNLLVHLIVPKFLTVLFLFLKDHIVTRRSIVESVVLMTIIQFGYAIFRDLAVYIISLPFDYGKLAISSGIDSVPRELLLVTAIQNHTTTSKNSIYGSVVASLQDCYDDYALKEGNTAHQFSALHHPNHHQQQSITNTIPTKSILQKDLVTTIPLAEHICHYYQRKLQLAYEAMKSYSNPFYYFPVTSSLHPWKNESFEDIIHHRFSYFTTFQFSLFYLFRCYGWFDLYQVAINEEQRDRREHIYEHDWHQIIDQGFQLLTETMLQMNIICDYVEGNNPLHLSVKTLSAPPIHKNMTSPSSIPEELKPKENLLKQMSDFKQRIEGASLQRNQETIEIERWQKKDSWIYRLLSFGFHVIPKALRKKISSSSFGIKVIKWWEAIRLSELFREYLLPILNRIIFHFPNPLEFSENQILPKHTITYFQEYFSPIYCQMMGNMIRSITILFHQALQEDVKGITLSTLPTFFLLLLQLDLSLQGFLEYCQPQFLLAVSNSSNSYSGEGGRFTNTQRRYKQRSAKQLPSHLIQLSTTIKEMICLLLSDYSDLLSITKSSVASSQRNHIINQNMYTKEIIERIRWYEEQVLVQ